MDFSPTSIALIVVSLLAAALLGFAAHRASFCSVKAVAEILSTGRAYMLASFMKTVLWVFAIALPLSWLTAPATMSSTTWALGVPAVAGGALFGVGAAMNGGCAFYTLTRLTTGNLALLFTLAGFVAGYYLQLTCFAGFASPPDSPLLALYERPGIGSLAWLAFVWLILGREIWRIWRSRESCTWKDRLLAGRYRLSFAAVLFGISNAMLFVLWGQWAYTSALRQQVIATHTDMHGPVEIKIGLFIAVLVGMLLSSWQRGDGNITWGKRHLWLIHLSGGTLMGMGAAIAPGGNDALLLYGIPMLSAHALPAFAAMFAAIAITLLLGKWIAGLDFRTNCKGDLYRAIADER